MRSTESGFNELVYLAAAQERLAAAENLLTTQRYVAAAYFSGVAVELLLLAYLTRSGVTHDAGHSLFGLANSGGFFDGLNQEDRIRLLGELNDVALRWRNNHRYRSEVAYREFLVRERLYVIEGQRTPRVDVVAHNTEALLESARRLVASGVARW